MFFFPAIKIYIQLPISNRFNLHFPVHFQSFHQTISTIILPHSFHSCKPPDLLLNLRDTAFSCLFWNRLNDYRSSARIVNNPDTCSTKNYDNRFNKFFFFWNKETVITRQKKRIIFSGMRKWWVTNSAANFPCPSLFYRVTPFSLYGKAWILRVPATPSGLRFHLSRNKWKTMRKMRRQSSFTYFPVNRIHSCGFHFYQDFRLSGCRNRFPFTLHQPPVYPRLRTFILRSHHVVFLFTWQDSVSRIDQCLHLVFLINFCKKVPVFKNGISSFMEKIFTTVTYGSEFRCPGKVTVSGLPVLIPVFHDVHMFYRSA